jgi:hypothetical protein
MMSVTARPLNTERFVDWNVLAIESSWFHPQRHEPRFSEQSSNQSSHVIDNIVTKAIRAFHF